MEKLNLDKKKMSKFSKAFSNPSGARKYNEAKKRYESNSYDKKSTDGMKQKASDMDTIENWEKE